VETHEGTGADSVQSARVKSLWVRTKAVHVLNYLRNTNVIVTASPHVANILYGGKSVSSNHSEVSPKIFKREALIDHRVSEPTARDKITRILLSVEGATKALGIKGPKTTYLDRVNLYDESRWDLDVVRAADEVQHSDVLAIHFFLTRDDLLDVYDEISRWDGGNMAFDIVVGATSHVMMVFDKSLSESLIPSDSGFLYNQGYIEHGYVDPGYVGTKTTMGI
jgi:hypothetical protein